MMGTVTYSDGEVVRFVNSSFAAHRVDTGARRDLLRRYNVYWTPSTMLVDKNGTARYRAVGFMPPADYLANLSLGRAYACYWDHRYGEAGEYFASTAASFPASPLAPQALYMGAVCARKTANDEGYLEQAALLIKERYPESEWARRVEPWL